MSLAELALNVVSRYQNMLELAENLDSLSEEFEPKQRYFLLRLLYAYSKSYGVGWSSTGIEEFKRWLESPETKAFLNALESEFESWD